MMRTLIWLTLAATATAVAACSSSNNSTTPPPAASCLATVGATGALVYPAQNAIGVSDSVGQVIVGVTTGLPQGWSVVLLSTGGTPLVPGNGFLPAPNPLPTPNTIPSFPNPVYLSSAMPTLPAATTFQVSVNNNNSSCLPTVVGIFTSQ